MDSRNHLVGHGLAVGHRALDGFNFDINKPYRYCRICGGIFQHEHESACLLWGVAHARTHSTLEHHQLRISQRWMTPEAAFKLAAFGIISLSDLLVDEEVAAALLLSSSIPTNDAKGVAT